MGQLSHGDIKLLGQRVPSYLSYPSTACFGSDVGAAQADAWSAALPADSRIGLYLHIPYCERICWFCSSRTQVASTPGQPEAYLQGLLGEAARAGAKLSRSVRVGRISFGGGTPTILAPAQIKRLGQGITAAFEVSERPEIAAEIDACNVTADQIAALGRIGLTEATVGQVDLDLVVQNAIGRVQDAATTSRAIGFLRAAGIERITLETVYGLPQQTEKSLRRTIGVILYLAPERVSLLGYAHVPHIAKRQQMIPDDSLPGTSERYALKRLAAALLEDAGYLPLGMDRFVLPGDPLLDSARTGRLRRTLEGYCDNRLAATIGLGASAVSQFAQGMVQNSVQTGDYLQRIRRGEGGGVAGVALSLEDRVRGRAIEMLMCEFRLDLELLRDTFGDFVDVLESDLRMVAEQFPGMVELRGSCLEITREGPYLARLVARFLDRGTAGPESCGLAV